MTTIEQGLKALHRLDLQEYPSHAGKGAVEDIAVARAALLDARKEIKVRDEAMKGVAGGRDHCLVRNYLHYPGGCSGCSASMDDSKCTDLRISAAMEAAKEE